MSLMMVEKVPDSTYDMVGGLSKQVHPPHAHTHTHTHTHTHGQVKEIKEVIELPVKHPELFQSLGIDQPKVTTTACDICMYSPFLLN